MARVSYNIWLLNRDMEPLLYSSNLTEADANHWLSLSAAKVYDGSDADGVLLLPSHIDPRSLKL